MSATPRPDPLELEADPSAERLRAVAGGATSTAVPRWRWPRRWVAVALVGVACIVAGGLRTWRVIHPPPGVVAADHARMIGPRGGARSIMPRGDFVVGWTPVSGATAYALTVTHSELGTLYVADGLTRTKLRLPAAVFERVPTGDSVRWQVTAELGDGDTVASRWFTSTLGD